MVRTEHSKSSFATALGVSLPLLTHITTGRNKPGMDIVQKLLLHFEQISPDWLLLGKGEMYRQEVKQRDLSPIVAQMGLLKGDLERIQLTHNTVVQYHKLLFDEIKHLDEMSKLIVADTEKLEILGRKLEELKNNLSSDV